MDEIWEKAVETSLEGQTDFDLVRTLTLDGASKCVQGRLPHPSLFEKFQNLQHLSMANIGVSSLEQFPKLQNLQKLILSDNRIAGGLEFLVAAGLESLRDLDLSNNKISNINDLRPLADLRLVSLDLYECPVTRMKDYRSRVFGLIRSLKYLDKMDAEGNERPESDDEEEDEEEEEDDPGSGEIDGDDHPSRLNNGQRAGNDGVVDVDDDEEESDADEEAETSRAANGSTPGGNLHQYTNGFRVEAVNGGEDEEEGDDDDDSVEEVYEDVEGEDEDGVEVHDVDVSDGEDGVEDDDGDEDDDDDGDEDDDDDEDDDEEEVDNDERDLGLTGSTSRLTTTEGEIDGHEQGEDDADEDDDGETGEEELAVEEEIEFEDEEEADDEEEDAYGSAGYLVQPVGTVEVDAGVGDLGEDEDPEMEEDIEYEEDEEDDGEVQELPSPSTSHKRKRSGDDDGDDDDDDDDGDEDEEDEDDDVVQHQYSKSSKHQ